MKRKLLIILSMLPLIVMAQKNVTVVNPKSDVPQKYVKSFERTEFNYDPFLKGKSLNQLNKKHPGYSAILIGSTYYDLQTNASVGRRVLLHDAHQVSAVWTTASVSELNWPSRGIGYNHKSSTIWNASVNTRIESQRTGWPSIGLLKNGNTSYEFTMGHISSTGGWVLSKNSAIGNTSFSTQTEVLKQLNNKVSIWGRAASNNKNYIHLVSNYYSSTSDGIPVVKLNGVSNPSTYSRSNDGGLTWDKQFIVLPGYDSTRTVAGGGDNYAIDVKDSVVAIVIGGLGDDVVLYKSTDNGNNFAKIMVEEFPYAPFTKKYVATTNRAKTNDGSLDVLIDNNFKVHVFFGRSYVADEDTTDDSYNFYPGTAELVHWAEGWDSVNTCGLAKDYNDNSTLDINPETTAFLDANGNLPANVSSATRYGSTSLVSFPSSATDANGNLYVTYSAVHEQAVSPYNANYRDIYVSFSTDGGLTWTIGQNITANANGTLANRENVFGSVAKNCDNFLHLVYQEDDLPGTNLQNNGNSNTHPNDENRIMYRAIPIADILQSKIGDVVSVNKVNVDPKIFFVSQNQPNPFASETITNIYLRDGSELDLTVSDITGKIVKSENLGFYSAGNSSISINAEGLKAGIYFYTISNSKYSITKKMQVN
ncbi:MAG: T9SS type A sorting domain-containing protein [Bacteroidia bacterium]|nr:T9SS type A sorting domain-containing protein [Bacteroidia bacterium]